MWDSTDEIILQALQRAGTEGLAKRSIFALFGRNRPAARIDAALARLQASGGVVSRQIPSRGRPRQVWHAELKQPDNLDALLDAIAGILQGMPSEEERTDTIQRLVERVGIVMAARAG